MKKIALVGDTHADEHNRFDEHNRILAWIVADAAERGCSLMLHSGDVWERRSTGRERLAVADYVRACAEHMPGVYVAGNHDDLADIEWLGRLRTRHPVRSLTRPEVVSLGGCSIACLPWPRKGTVLAQSTSLEGSNQTMVAGLQDILRGLGAQLAEQPGPRLLLAHCMLRGSRTSLSQPPLTGCDLELSLADLALVGASFSALGHIHMGAGNEWEIDGNPAAFPGSPRRCNYGEIEEKSYIVLTYEGDKLIGWERIPTPCTPMLHMEAAFTVDDRGDCFSLPALNGIDTHGAEIRLRYTVAAAERNAARYFADEAKSMLLMRGAKSVKVEEVVIATKRARAPEVARAVGIADKLDAHWHAIGLDPTAEYREALHTRAREIEQEVASCV